MRIKTGIVGLGSIAKTHCLANVAIALNGKDLPFELKIGRILRQNSSEPAPFFSEGYARDLEELIADSDVVDICSPNAAHFQQAEAVIGHGRPLYLEKPAGKDMAEAETLQALAETSGTPNQVVLMYRFMPGIVAMRDRIARGDIGPVIGFQVRVLHSGYLNPDRKSNWKLKKDASGGGPLLDIGVHSADAVRFLLGEVEAVQCRVDTVIGRRPDEQTGCLVDVDVEDRAFAQLIMQSGVTGTVEITRVASVLEQSSTIEVFGLAGSMHFSCAEPGRLRVFTQRTGREEYGKVDAVSDFAVHLTKIYPKSSLGWLTDAHTASLMNFYLNLAAGCVQFPETPDIAQAVLAQRIIDRCYQSAAVDGGIVQLA